MTALSPSKIYENEQPKLLAMWFFVTHEPPWKHVFRLTNIQFGQNLGNGGFFRSRTSSIDGFDQSLKESSTKNMLEKNMFLL